jgi:hypothetical protein
MQKLGARNSVDLMRIIMNHGHPAVPARASYETALRQQQKGS